MDHPLVSVLLPVKNGERFIAQALDSVIGQDYQPIELFVIDGRSTDGTHAIVRRYPQAVLIEQKEKGIADAWNLGIARAVGTFVAFISSDDRWTPDKLTRQVRFMHEHPERMLSIAKFRFFLEPGCDVPKGFNPTLLDRDLVGRLPETLMVRREIHEKVGLFDPARGIAFDVDWFARAKDMGFEPGIVPQVLLHKRVHDENASSNAELNTRLLLQILRDSIRRQKQQGEQSQSP